MYFLSWSHDLGPHHMGKSKKDASTDSGLGASAQTLVLRRISFEIAVLIDLSVFQSFNKFLFWVDVEFAEQLKAFGNEAYANKEFRKAIKFYDQAIQNAPNKE